MRSSRSLADKTSACFRSVTALRAGDWVEVRSLPEILATLDSEGKLDFLPFMPEMIRFCGKKFMVAKRAEKTCFAHVQRRMGDAIHLTDLRCDGSAHDGCQAACLLFWREDWLKRVSKPIGDSSTLSPTSDAATNHKTGHNLCTRTTARGGETYVCQATELEKASDGELNLWDLDQYYREIRAGNVGWPEIKHLFRWSLAWFQWWIFRRISGKQRTPPSTKQNIAPGDLVEVRPRKEIFHSLTKNGTHLGLTFSAEMLTFSGKRCRVLAKVQRLIDEQTGKMKILKNNCLILDSAICKGHCTFCPRAEFLFWRDEWLRRVQ